MTQRGESLQEIGGRAAAAIRRLVIDRATADVLRAFTSAGVESLLLKGRSMEAWLSQNGDRLSYLDADLLIRPGDEGPAADVLANLGFEQRMDQNTLPEWWREHGTEWSRSSDGVLVDLHHSIPGVGVGPQAAWLTLSAVRETIPVGGYSAWTLTVPGRAAHVALHAAHHGAHGPKAVGDLERALAISDDQLWEAAAALAEQLEAIDAFAAGLRLTANGAALADRLGLPALGSVEVAVRAATAPPVALGFDQLARAAGPRRRIEILARKVVPPPSFMRHWWPASTRNGRWLALAYLYRQAWLLWHAPRGLRAWLRARRSVHRDS